MISGLKLTLKMENEELLTVSVIYGQNAFKLKIKDDDLIDIVPALEPGKILQLAVSCSKENFMVKINLRSY